MEMPCETSAFPRRGSLCHAEHAVKMEGVNCSINADKVMDCPPYSHDLSRRGYDRFSLSRQPALKRDGKWLAWRWNGFPRSKLRYKAFVMADIMSVENRSQLMARIRGKDTTPERYINTLLEATGVECERHAVDLPGRPDFVFRDERLAVFVDGDFWHGSRIPVWEHRLSDEWRKKIAKNRSRDCRSHRQLRRSGWQRSAF